MKKVLCLIAVLALLLAGCGAEPAVEETSGTTTTQIETQIQPETQTEPQTEEPKEEWAVLTPPLDYEIINGFAKTPTHYYAPYDGGIVRAPIDNIARQEKIPLPDSYEGMKLSGAEICGITEKWLFVNVWEAREKIRHEYEGGYWESEDYEDRTCVTYRIAIGSWKAEAIAAGVYNYRRPLPWYNAVSDSLLIPGEAGFDVMPLSTRKRVPGVLDSDQMMVPYWRNAMDGRAVLVDPCSDQQEEYRFYVFDKSNQVCFSALEGINFPVRYGTEAPKNKAEEELRKLTRNDGWINEYVTCGEYVYYILYEDGIPNFYRVRTDGTERMLLREKTNIQVLCSAGDMLFCLAYNPTFRPKNDWEGGQIDICHLNKEGKVDKVLFHYQEDTEGNSGYGLLLYGNKVLVVGFSIYGPGYFVFLYDPATGAKFPAG